MRQFVFLVLCVLALPPSAGAWTWPVDGPVVRGFSFDPDHPYAGGQHRGIDIAASDGTPVRAPAEGHITFAGNVPGGGRTISIETPLGYTATLLHLGSIAVARDAHVGEGAVVGAVGGDSYVYLGVRATPKPQGYVDPLGFLPVRPDPVTTPVDGTSSAPAAAEPTQQAAAAQAPGAPAAASAPAAGAASAAAAGGQQVVGADSPSAEGRGTAAGATPSSPVSAPTAARARPTASSLHVRQTDNSGAVHASQAGAAADRGSPPIEGEANAGRAQLAHASSLADLSIEHSLGGGVRVADGVRPSAPRTEAAGDAPHHATEGRAVRADGEPPQTVRPVSPPHARSDVSSEHRDRPGAASHVRASAHGAVLGRDRLTLAAALAALVSVAAAVVLRRRAARRRMPARIMSGVGRSFEQEPILVGAGAEQEGSRRARVAVRERAAPSRSRGGVRRAGGHLRAVPPVDGERRVDGEWHGRARHSGDGHSRPGTRLAA